MNERNQQNEYIFKQNRSFNGSLNAELPILCLRNMQKPQLSAFSLFLSNYESEYPRNYCEILENTMIVHFLKVRSIYFN